eukprot:6210058-Pleurochrysis_carterae.AAC.2
MVALLTRAKMSELPCVRACNQYGNRVVIGQNEHALRDPLVKRGFATAAPNLHGCTIAQKNVLTMTRPAVIRVKAGSATASGNKVSDSKTSETSSYSKQHP